LTHNFWPSRSTLAVTWFQVLELQVRVVLCTMLVPGWKMYQPNDPSVSRYTSLSQLPPFTAGSLDPLKPTRPWRAASDPEMDVAGLNQKSRVACSRRGVLASMMQLGVAPAPKTADAVPDSKSVESNETLCAVPALDPSSDSYSSRAAGGSGVLVGVAVCVAVTVGVGVGVGPGKTSNVTVALFELRRPSVAWKVKRSVPEKVGSGV